MLPPDPHQLDHLSGAVAVTTHVKPAGPQLAYTPNPEVLLAGPLLGTSMRRAHIT